MVPASAPGNCTVHTGGLSGWNSGRTSLHIRIHAESRKKPNLSYASACSLGVKTSCQYDSEKQTMSSARQTARHTNDSALTVGHQLCVPCWAFCMLFDWLAAVAV